LPGAWRGKLNCFVLENPLFIMLYR